MTARPECRRVDGSAMALKSINSVVCDSALQLKDLPGFFLCDAKDVAVDRLAFLEPASVEESS